VVVTITALLELTLRPDDLAASMKEVDAVLAQTAAFPGCQGVEVLVDLTDPTHVTVVERWESEEADAAYREWRTTPEGRSTLGSLLTGPPALVRYRTH
jgi:heme oxygenase (mycobilin-producing)